MYRFSLWIVFMQYAQLRAFHAVALHGGFSKAAEALHLTQPAISDQVRRLEQEFGVSLFDRRPRSVEPTAIGRRLLAATRRFFDAEQEARDILTAARSLSAGSLTMYTDAPYLAMRLIAEFRKRHPGIEIKVLTGNAEHCLESVLDFRADVAISAATRQDARLTSLPLHREPLAAVMVPDHPLASAESIRLAELVREPLIFREPLSVTRRLFEDDLARRGISCVPAMEVESREALVEAVSSGLGIGVMAPSELGRDRRLVSVPISDAKSIMTDSLVKLADRPPSAIIDAVFDVAAELTSAGG
jgi:aminoethylphosphonate catabolism LysR family transcriptional regulator